MAGADTPVHQAAKRGWGPTLVIFLAVVLVAVVGAETGSLSATAAPIHKQPKAHSPRDGSVARGTRAVAHVTPGVSTSPNWSGYVAYAASFNEVSAQWIEPSVTCTKNNAWTLFWVGFDGWPQTDGTVEQGGTSARCVKGVPQYTAFWEMWPTKAVMPTFTVSPGDQIDASVAYMPATKQFIITVTDETNGQTDTESQTCAVALGCARSSAEWIAESPSHFGTNKWFPLANYRTMEFTAATATSTDGITGPISDHRWVNSGIERVAGAAKALAEVSSLNPTGTAFSDTWRRK